MVLRLKIHLYELRKGMQTRKELPLYLALAVTLALKLLLINRLNLRTDWIWRSMKTSQAPSCPRQSSKKIRAHTLRSSQFLVSSLRKMLTRDWVATTLRRMAQILSWRKLKSLLSAVWQRRASRRPLPQKCTNLLALTTMCLELWTRHRLHLNVK